jgi:hypothetical protein
MMIDVVLSILYLLLEVYFIALLVVLGYAYAFDALKPSVAMPGQVPERRWPDQIDCLPAPAKEKRAQPFSPQVKRMLNTVNVFGCVLFIVGFTHAISTYTHTPKRTVEFIWRSAQYWHEFRLLEMILFACGIGAFIQYPYRTHRFWCLLGGLIPVLLNLGDNLETYFISSNIPWHWTLVSLAPEMLYVQVGLLMLLLGVGFMLSRKAVKG